MDPIMGKCKSSCQWSQKPLSLVWQVLDCSNTLTVHPLSTKPMSRRALAGLLAFFLVAAMLIKLPAEAALIRALDLDMQLVELCDAGDERACNMIQADAVFESRVCGETEKMQGACLYVTEKGVAVRAQGGRVADVAMRAALLAG